MVNLFLVRHGEKDKKEILDSKNRPLTKKGRSQATRVGKTLKDIKFEKIYVSNYKRAKETYKLNKGYFKAPVVSSSNLNEIVSESVGKRAPNTEAKKTEVERGKAGVENFLKEIRKYDKEDNILVFTHGNVIRYIISKVLGFNPKDAWDIVVFNASITVVKLTEERDMLIGLNTIFDYSRY